MLRNSKDIYSGAKLQSEQDALIYCIILNTFSTEFGSVANFLAKAWASQCLNRAICFTKIEGHWSQWWLPSGCIFCPNFCSP